MNHENQHINQNFEQAIRDLRAEVIALGAIARLNLERAMQGLLGRDVDLCKAAIADDNDADEAERRIDALGMEILVRFHPYASDLRLVISSMKITSNLERISDHAVNIAKRGKKITAFPEAPDALLLEPLYQLAVNLLDRSLESFTDRSTEIGESLTAQDKELDQLEKKLVATFGSRLEKGGELAEVYLHLIFIARSLERIGDLSVNIGEDSVYLASAQDIRHQK